MTSRVAVPVRQVVREHLDVGERSRELLDAGRVRAVAAADEERALVEPDRVAALDRPGRLDPRGDGNAGALEVGDERVGLAEPAGLAGPEEDGAARRRRAAGRRRRSRRGCPASPCGDDDLRAGLLEQHAERLVLGGRGGGIGLGAPAVLAPARGVRRLRRADEHAPQRRGHRLAAVAHGSRNASRRAAGTPRRTDGRPRPSIPPASARAAPGPRASRGTGAPARPARRSARSARGSAGSARGQPLFHGRTFATVTRRPSSSPRRIIARRFAAASATGRPCAMSLMPPWTTSTAAPSAASSSQRGDLVRALAVHRANGEAQARIGLRGRRRPADRRRRRPTASRP